MRQQAAVAELGREAVAGAEIGVLMDRAVRLVAEALEADLCKVLELDPERDVLLLKAGTGWDEGLVGHALVSCDEASQAGFTLQSEGPVIVDDLRSEHRFGAPPLLRQHGAVSGASVLIPGVERPYGILSAHTTSPRPFGRDDAHFLQSVANVLAEAVSRARTQKSIRESEARLRAILETTVDAVITIDEQARIELFNQAAEHIFGYAADEVMGANVKVLMPEPYRSEHDTYMDAYHETGRRRIIGIGREVVGRRKDGTTFPIDLAVSEVHLEDRRIFTAVIRDITSRRDLEREILRISDAERRRIGQDLHDGLGQMLTGIGLISQGLARRLEAADAEGADEVAEVAGLVKEADRYARDLSRGLVPVELDAQGLSRALQRLASKVGALLGAECTYEQTGDVRLEDDAAATHLYRIAQEAASNAVRHGQASQVVISLTGTDELLQLRVQDDGSGFEKGGNDEGMGLRIMQHRASIIGAALEIASQPGQGTTITCSLRSRGQPFEQGLTAR